jgi:hypothetical protein
MAFALLCPASQPSLWSRFGFDFGFAFTLLKPAAGAAAQPVLIIACVSIAVF